jgi:hypothetical protein
MGQMAPLDAVAAYDRAARPPDFADASRALVSRFASLWLGLAPKPTRRSGARSSAAAAAMRAWRVARGGAARTPPMG